MQAPVALAAWGSFHVGGRLVQITGKPVREVTLNPGGVPARIDPSGTYMAGSLYAQYMIPADCCGRFPLLLWHGGGLTGACWETTPDGREGWQHFFLRRGWATCVSDAVERGGTIEIIDLPERGISGNSHMIMMDRNSDEIAELVQSWLTAKRLWI